MAELAARARMLHAGRRDRFPAQDRGGGLGRLSAVPDHPADRRADRPATSSPLWRSARPSISPACRSTSTANMAVVALPTTRTTRRHRAAGRGSEAGAGAGAPRLERRSLVRRRFPRLETAFRSAPPWPAPAAAPRPTAQCTASPARVQGARGMTTAIPIAIQSGALPTASAVTSTSPARKHAEIGDHPDHCRRDRPEGGGRGGIAGQPLHMRRAGKDEEEARQEGDHGGVSAAGDRPREGGRHAGGGGSSRRRTRRTG